MGLISANNNTHHKLKQPSENSFCRPNPPLPPTPQKKKKKYHHPAKNKIKRAKAIYSCQMLQQIPLFFHRAWGKPFYN